MSPFSGVTKSGRVWRKVPESDARNVRRTLNGAALFLRSNQRLNELVCVCVWRARALFYSQKSDTLQCLTLVWFTLSHLLLVPHGLEPHLALATLFSSSYLFRVTSLRAASCPCFPAPTDEESSVSFVI